MRKSGQMPNSALEIPRRSLSPPEQIKVADKRRQYPHDPPAEPEQRLKHKNFVLEETGNPTHALLPPKPDLKLTTTILKSDTLIQVIRSHRET